MKHKKTNRSALRYNEEDERTLLEDILDFVKVFVICGICILIFVNFIARPVTVVGKSMDPTLQDGEFGFTSVISTMMTEPKRGEIVVLKMEDPQTKEISHWVKRIIGLPNETIESRNGEIYINGQLLDETAYINQEHKQALINQYGFFNEDFGPIVLNEDEYFAMGDNRPFSKDSRDISVGPVKKDQIFGKSVFVLFPLSQIGPH